MCRAVRCGSCGKTTWAGCGAHVDQVMSRVAPADRCGCPPQTGGGLWAAIKKGITGR